MEIYIWLGITVLALVIEALTNELLTIWFAIGGLIAIILSAFNVSWYINTIVFLAVSFALVLSLRKISLRLLSGEDSKTNADAAFGKEFVLLSEISLNKPGEIKVNDVVWGAVTENDGELVKEGTLVKVLYLKGNKYVVKPLSEREKAENSARNI